MTSNFELLSGDGKQSFSNLLVQRYSGDENLERDVQQIVERLAKEPSRFAALVAPDLLTKVAEKVTFAGGEPDNGRLRILNSFQDRLPAAAKSSLVPKMEAIINPSRGAKVDVPVKNVANYLLNVLKPHVLSGTNLKELFGLLIKQAEAQPLATKGVWLKPLFNLQSLCSPEQKSSLTTIMVAALSNPADIASLTSFLKEIGPEYFERSLSFEGVKAALSEQAAFFDRQSPSEKFAHRNQIIDALPYSTSLSDLDVYDWSRAWDLSVFTAQLRKALENEELPIEELRERLASFVQRAFGETASFSTSIFDDLYALFSSNPELFTEDVLEHLSNVVITFVGDAVETRHDQLISILKLLPEETRIEKLRDLVSRYVASRSGGWIEILRLLGRDLSEEAFQGAQGALAAELMDFSFDGARDFPEEVGPAMVSLRSLLSDAQLQSYVERAVDVLVSYEAIGKPVGQMEPYLQFIEGAASSNRIDWPSATSRLVSNMLAPASGTEEKKRALAFVARVGLAGSNPTVRNEIENLLTRENESEISESAAQLLK